MTRASRIRPVVLSSPSHRQLAQLDNQIAEHKKVIREERSELREAARQRAVLVRKLKQFGIEYVEHKA